MGWAGLLAALPLLLPLLATGGANAATIAIDGRDRIPLDSVAMLRDPGRSLTLADIRGEAAGRFEPAPGRAEGFSLGFTADAVWLRADLSVAEAAAGRHVLTLDAPNFDRLEVWASWTAAGTAADTGTDTGTDGAPPLALLGDRVARTMPTRLHAAAIDLPAGRHTLWLRAISTSSMAVPLDLWRPDALWAAEQGEIQLHTTLTAFIVLLGLGALLLAVTLPSLAMALYAGSALAAAGHVVAMNGLDALMWGGHAVFGDIASVVWLVWAGVLGAGFLLATLPLRRHARWAIPVLGAPAALGAVLLAGYPFLDSYTRPLAIPLATNLMLVVLVAGLAASLQCRLAGHRPASYMVFGWLALAGGNLLAGLRNAGLLPWTEWTYYLPAYAPMVEMLFFGAMLAAQLRLLRHEKDRAQRTLVAAMRQNEAELARRVAERTAALDHANAALHEREAQLRRILEAAPFPILLFQPGQPRDGQAQGDQVQRDRVQGDRVQGDRARTLYANRRARLLFLGGTEESLSLRPTADFYQHPADRDRLLARLERDGVVENAEVEMRGFAGNRFWALASMVAIDYEGAPARLVAVNDISARKRLEHDLTKAKELAEAAVGLERAAREAQRQFLAMISHEFRTPLTVIGMAAQNLEPEVTGARPLERLARIGRAVRHLNDMIDACLLEDRIDGAGLVLRSGALDLAALAHGIADSARAAAPHHAIAVRVGAGDRPGDWPGDWPETTGDAQLLGIALSNLVENAVKYSPRGGTVEVALDRDGETVAVTVADQGSGVPDDEHERIFEKYHRAADTGGVPGAGLGLYLTRRIVAAHGGTVRVRNRPEGGALFTIRLPLHGSPASDDTASRQVA